jgi:hypothetical protein
MRQKRSLPMQVRHKQYTFSVFWHQVLCSFFPEQTSIKKIRIHHACFLPTRLGLMSYWRSKLRLKSVRSQTYQIANHGCSNCTISNLVKMWFLELKLGDALTSCPPWRSSIQMTKKQVKEKREALLPIWVTDSRHDKRIIIYLRR